MRLRINLVSTGFLVADGHFNARRECSAGAAASIEPASIEIDAWNKKHVEIMFGSVITWFQQGFVSQTGISMLGVNARWVGWR